MKYSLKQRLLVVAGLLFVVLAGFYSLTQLKIEAYPDVADTEVIVITEFPGRAASEVERLVTIPFERTLNGLPKVITRRSQSILGLSIVRLTFDENVNDYFARTLVTEKLSEVILPEGVEPPVLGPLSTPVGEILRYVIESDEKSSIMDVRTFQTWELIPRLLQSPGVADVITFGGEIKQYQIEINPINQDKYDVTLKDIAHAVEENNANTGGNVISRGNQGIPLRAIGAIENESDIESVIVTTKKEIPIFIRDIGKVKIVPATPKGILGYSLSDPAFTQSNGVQGLILMRRGENPSEVIHNIKSRFIEIEKLLQEKGMKIRFIYDREELVSVTLKTVVRTMLEGISIVVFMLIFLLGSVRAAIATAITIPVSLLFAFTLMHITGIPANLLSLGAIDFGIIVDSSVVIIENIFSLIRKNDLKKKKSDIDKIIETSSGYVEKEVIYSIVIILLAYLPIFLFQRVEGKLFRPMAFTLFFTLLGALIFSLTVLPVIIAFFFRKPIQPKEFKIFEWMKSLYIKHLEKILLHPGKFLRIVSVSVGTILIVFIFISGTEFLPELDEGSLNLRCILPSGVHLKRTAEIAEGLRTIAMEYPEVKAMVTQTGRNDDGTDPFGSNRIEALITLIPYSQWKTVNKKSKLIEILKNRMIAEFPGVRFSFSQPILDNVSEAVTGSAADLSIQISGADVVELRKKAEEILHLISPLKGVAGIGIEQEGPQTELIITMDREAAARAGINFSDVQDLTEMAIGGKEISRLYKNNQSYAITVRYPEEARATIHSIGNLLIRSKTNKKYPLSSIAKIELKESPSMIARKNGRRMVSVWVSIKDRDQGSFVAEAKKVVSKNIVFPENMNIEWGGQFENLTRAGKRLVVVVPITLLLVIFTLYSMFKNITDTLLVLSTIPIAIAGGSIFLIVRSMNLNVSAGVGFISLFGVSIMSGVIYISHFRSEWRKNTHHLNELVLQVSADQFRPRLLMMSVAILGLLPAMFTTAIGSDVQRPMATVIVGGLIFALILGMYTMPLLTLKYYKRTYN